MALASWGPGLGCEGVEGSEELWYGEHLGTSRHGQQQGCMAGHGHTCRTESELGSLHAEQRSGQAENRPVATHASPLMGADVICVPKTEQMLDPALPGHAGFAA